MLHLLLLLFATSAHSPPATVSRITRTAESRAATIRGRIDFKPAPARRVANRYAAAASPRTQQELPLVVFLRGKDLTPARPATRPALMAQHDTAFAPAFVIVTRGSTVNFQNQDPFYHNVFSYSKPKRFDLGRFPRPELKAITFDKEGMVDVFCEIHKSMRGIVLVTETEHYVVVAADGSYELAGVPAGSYELVVWHADRGQKVIPVTVPASGVLTINAAL